jgi:hypothetical protein
VERRGGLACDFDALCDFDRRIHTSESHEASISHVISRRGRVRPGPTGTGVAFRTLMCTVAENGQVVTVLCQYGTG